MRKIFHMNQRNFIFALTVASTFAIAPLSFAQDKLSTELQSNKSSGKPQPVNSVAVVVNDDVITKQELDERLSSVEKRLIEQKMALPPREVLQKQLLEKMIVDLAQVQLAKESGMRVDDITLDRAMQKLAEQNKMSLQVFRNAVEKDGTPFAKFREDIRNEILMQRIREREVDSKIQVSETEVDNFLAAEKASAAAQQELNLAQILVRIPENASPEQIAAKRARAEEAMQKIKSGGDFTNVAMTYSDASDALKGGDLGWRMQDRLPQLFLDAISNLNSGEVSGIVKSPNGFHIIKVLGKRSGAEAKANAPEILQTHVRHILIKVNQVTSAAEAKRKLLELKERLDNKAATFEDLAKTFSNDGSASKGGDLGWVYPGDTVPEFEKAMNELQPGQISAPIETQYGYHLIQVVERKSQDVSQDRQRMAARQALRERKGEEATQDWLRQLRDRAYVENRLEEK
jgi:peptidyl-prolyl cis-trans isomerase SurA